MENKIKTKTKNENKDRALLTNPTKRVNAARKIKGIWKNRKPNPIKELERIRREWNR